MNSDSEIWFAFARTFGMLFIVLALLLAGFYLIRRLSVLQGLKSNRDLIRVLAVHHLSPKEKLVLVNVLETTILIGVTPNRISRIAALDGDVDMPVHDPAAGSAFSGMLSRALGKPLETPGPGQGGTDR